jgi:hypothetical protein
MWTPVDTIVLSDEMGDLLMIASQSPRWRRRRTVRRSITALLLAAGLTGSLAACGSADHQSKQAAAPSAGQPLLFDDEFNGPSGAAPDTRVWRAERGNAEADGWGTTSCSTTPTPPTTSPWTGTDT